MTRAIIFEYGRLISPSLTFVFGLFSKLPMQSCEGNALYFRVYLCNLVVPSYR